MRRRFLLFVALVGCLLGGSIAWTASTVAREGLNVTVPGTSTIWLANQPNGTAYRRLPPFREDLAPQQSPVAIELSSLGHPTSLAFRVDGKTSRDGFDPSTGADGEEDSESVGPAFDVGQTGAPFMSLVGMFIDRDQQAGSADASDFSNHDQRSFDSLSPGLRQVFFIGDGLTGTGEGQRQRFNVPEGADVLFLAPFDFESSNNAGELEVAVLTLPPEVRRRVRDMLEERARSPSPDPSLDQVVERLRQSKAAHIVRMREQGRTAGEAWAREFAEYDELRRLAHLSQSRDWPPANAEAVMRAATDSGASAEQFFHLESPADARKLADPRFLEAFLEGAKSVWDQVEGRL